MKILDRHVPLRDNLLYSFDRYTVWWIILLVTVFYDFLSTLVFVSRYGPGAEANLITRFLMITVGPAAGNFLGKLLQLFSVVCFVSLHRRLGNLFLLVVILINCFAIVVNSIS